VFDLVLPAAFEDVQGADNVTFDVGVRVFQRVTHARLGAEVRDLVEGVLGEQGFHRRAVGKVDASHFEAGVIVEDRGAGLFQRHVVVVVEVVEADDGVTAFEQRFGGEEADEAGGAGDEDFQDCLSMSNIHMGPASHRRSACHCALEHAIACRRH